MSAPKSLHPEPSSLQAFASGTLEAVAAEAIEVHLRECQSCCDSLGSIGDDDFVSQLKQLGPQTLVTLGSTPSSHISTLPAIPGYEIERELGRGGMGVVYQARHLRLQRTVALKVVLAGNLASPSDLVRLRSEAEVAANLQHPHIVQIYEIGDHDGRPFLALEYVPDGTLEQLMQGTPQSPPDAARLVAVVARTMAHAHEQGVVHRDLKPANILIKKTSGGTTLGQAEPKIADFGLAKWRDHDHGLTKTGMVAGTPSYMAPEQARGGLAHVGPSVDVYAIGAILYELLTGRPPFKGESAIDTLAMVLDSEPVPPHQLQPRIPRDIETICLKCLQKEPANRYASAAELADDLDRYVAGDPIKAQPISDVERVWRWAKRRPAISGLLAGILVVTLAGIIGILWQWLQAEEQRQQALDNASEARKAQAATHQALEQAERNVYLSRIARARLDWLHNHDVANAEALLEQCKPAHGGKDYRGWEWYYLRRLVKGDRHILKGHTGDLVMDVAFSPDGEQILSTAYNPFLIPAGSVRQVDAFLWDIRRTHPPVKLPIPPLGSYRVAYSPDGKWLAIASHDGVRIWDRSAIENAPRWVQPAHKRLVSCLAFHPENNWLALGNDKGNVSIYDHRTDNLLREQIVGDHIHSLGFSTDGKRWAVCASKQGAAIWSVGQVGTDLKTSEGQQTLLHGNLQRAGFNHDLTLLAIADDTARVFDVETGRLVQSYSGHQGQVLAVAFHPDNKSMVSGGSDRSIRIWDLARGKEQSILRGHVGRVSCLAFDPAGRKLVSGGQQPPELVVWNWDQQAGQRLFRYYKKEGNTEAVAFTHDKSRLLAAYAGGNIRAYDLASGSHEIVQAELTRRWQSPAKLATFQETDEGMKMAAVSQDSPLKIKLLHIPTSPLSDRATQLGELQGHTTEVYQVVMSRDGRFVAAAGILRQPSGNFREIIVWNAATFQQVARFVPKPASDTKLQGGLALSIDGKFIAYDDYSNGSACVHVIEVATRQMIKQLSGNADTVMALAFSDDGARLASADRSDQLCLYDLSTGQPISITMRGPHQTLVFSPDNQRLAAINRKEVKLWDAINGQEIMVLQGQAPGGGDPGFNPCVVWSRDGKRLAANNHNETITVWESE